MKNKLAILGGTPVISEKEAHFEWPRITDETREAVMKQLEKDVSIYDRSGIFAEFEDAFSAYHGTRHALLSNSGTSALFSMYEGLGLSTGDEVICPAYTFFATVSPMMYTGATPIFCDCRDDGNINPDEIERHITSKTRAVIITHMWGIPCEMDRIKEICARHSIALLEDCSHAHGASFKGQKVGSFGSAAAWSIQGQKVISGGEGGVLLTNSDDIFYRALLQGHYNKRCKNEIPKEHPLAKFSLTGFGQKFRAHPLAIAMANQQFRHLDEWVAQKSIFAKQFTDAFADYPFLCMPSCPDGQPSWYAFVMQFNAEFSNGVPIEKFTKALHAEGLIEVDMPGSTCPIQNLPLFIDSNEAMPRLYSAKRVPERRFDNAQRFYEQAIKLPMWAFPEDYSTVERYIEGFRKVMQVVTTQPELLR